MNNKTSNNFANYSFVIKETEVLKSSCCIDSYSTDSTPESSNFKKIILLNCNFSLTSSVFQKVQFINF